MLRKILALVLLMCTTAPLIAEHHSHKCHDCKSTQLMTFDIFDSNGDPLGIPFTVQIQIVRQGKIVQLHLPALDFATPPANPDTGTVDGGFVQTISGFLPKDLRPNDALYQSATLESDQTGSGYNIYIGTDGALRIVSPGDNFIPSGPQIAHAKTITYQLPLKCLKAPKNFAVSEGSSQMNQHDNPDINNQFLEYYQNSIVNDTVAYCWADNADTKNTPPYNLNVMTRTGRLINKGCKAEVKLDEPVLAFQAPLGTFCSENSITINPTNPDNIVWISGTTNRLVSSHDPARFQLLVGTSFDRGQNWTTYQVDTGNMPHFRTDSVGLFDDFGNLWIAYSSRPSATNFGRPRQLVIGLSTDGGLSFNVAYQSTDATATMDYDYPQLAFGGDGNGGLALWCTSNFVDPFTAFPWLINLVAIPVSSTGVPDLGGIISRSFDSGVAGPTNIGIGNANIAVSNSGQVFLANTFTNTFTNIPNNNLSFSLMPLYINPKGMNFTPDDIIGPRVIANTNLGLGVQPPFVRNITFQNVRGIDAPSQTIVLDRNRNILYALINEVDPPFTIDQSLYLVFSENGGQSWSQRIPISDYNKGNRSLASMAVDPITNNLVFNWYDTRNDPSGNTVRFFSTALLASYIDKIRGSDQPCHINLKAVQKIKCQESNIPPTINTKHKLKRQRDSR